MNNETILKTMKSLSNKIRIDILLYLLDGEKCVCSIFEKLKLPQNLISHHLSIMYKNKLLLLRKDGKWSYYRINTKTFMDITGFLKIFIGAKSQNFSCL